MWQLCCVSFYFNFLCNNEFLSCQVSVACKFMFLSPALETLSANQPTRAKPHFKKFLPDYYFSSNNSSNNQCSRIHLKVYTERQDFLRKKAKQGLICNGNKNSKGFLMWHGVLVELVLFLEGKIDIVWEEGAAQLDGGSSNFFPKK